MKEREGSTSNGLEESGSGMTETVQQAAASTVDNIQEIASSVAGTAQEAVSGVVDKVQDVTGAVTGAVADQANRVTDAAADQVESLADTVYQQAATPGAPALQRNMAEKTVNVLDRTADYIREGDVRLILEDLRGAIQRNPGRSVLLGLVAGYLARSTFFGGASAKSIAATQRPEPFSPISQAVPVSSDEFGMGLDTAYSTSVMSGSTLSSDIAAARALDTLPMSSGLTTASDSLFLGEGTESLEADGDLLGATSMSDILADGGSFGSEVDTFGASTGSNSGMLDASSDTGSMMQDDRAAGATLDSDDIDAVSIDAADEDLAGETRQLGGEDFRSDSSSTATMPSDELLARWDAETRDRTDDA